MVTKINKRYLKHLLVWVDQECSANVQWTPPQPSWLKLNADVVIRLSRSYIAVSVKDSCSSLYMIYIERLGAMDPFGKAEELVSGYLRK